jgi:hypothetical protein
MNIVLPDIASWLNYVPQSDEIEGHLFWYGVPHPTQNPPVEGSTLTSGENFPKSSILAPNEPITETPPLILTDNFMECSNFSADSEFTDQLPTISSPPRFDLSQSLRVAPKQGVEIIKEVTSVGLLAGCIIGFCLFAVTSGIAIYFFFKGYHFERVEQEEMEASSGV